MLKVFSKFSKKIPFKLVVMVMFMVLAISDFSYAANVQNGGNATELDDVWSKVSDGISGTYGKLASVGIIGAAIWHREKIGMLAMGVGIIIGALVPSIPGMIDNFSATI